MPTEWEHANAVRVPAADSEGPSRVWTKLLRTWGMVMVVVGATAGWLAVAVLDFSTTNPEVPLRGRPTPPCSYPEAKRDGARVVHFPVMEAKYQTAIDPRPPRSFPNSEIMAGRAISFKGSMKADMRKPEKFLPTAMKECVHNPVGIAAAADWAFNGCLYGDPDLAGGPKLVHVNKYTLSHFVNKVLPKLPLSYRFVLLVSGSDDLIPRGSDPRFVPLLGFADDESGGPAFQTLVTDPRIVHW
jgi:hypothetical protein